LLLIALSGPEDYENVMEEASPSSPGVPSKHAQSRTVYVILLDRFVLDLNLCLGPKRAKFLLSHSPYLYF
jgi:hypothetical protein